MDWNYDKFWVIVWSVGFFYFQKMTFLDFFDMYLLIFDMNSQYFVEFNQYLVLNGVYWQAPFPKQI